jgi:hypothetical protein
MTDTPNLGLPFIEGSQAQKHVTHNEGLRILDAAIQVAVLDLNRTAPPSSPAEGERHVVAAGATGAWAGHANAIATWQDGAWAFLSPKTGWCIWSATDAVIFVFDATVWRDLRSLSFDNAPHVGVNTTADSTNRLSVKSNAALLGAINTADGGSGDVRIQLSKESASKTASVFFSDTFSGRAEFGLVGSDAFKLKVSADGSAWVEAFNIDQSTGNLALPRGLILTGVISPPQITANQNDYSPTGIAAASVLQLSSDALRTISGFAGGAEGRVVSIVNVGSQPIALSDEGTASSAANRFALGSNLTIASKQAAMLRYDGGAARWRLISGAAGLLAAANNLSDLASAAAARANLGIREVLAANRTYYVRADGSDANSGLANSSGAAFLTIQKAYDVIAGTLDLGGRVATIQIGDGTYTAGLAATNPIVGGTLVMNGNAATPANVVISTTSTDAVAIKCPAIVTVQNLEVRTTASGSGWLAQGGGAHIRFGVGVRFGACAGFHMRAVSQGYIENSAQNYSIVGAAPYHQQATVSSVLDFQSATVTITGAPAFSTAFIVCDVCSAASMYNMTYSGSATGVRYGATMGSSIQTYGGGANYFPGNAAGSTASGGQYQ